MNFVLTRTKEKFIELWNSILRRLIGELTSSLVHVLHFINFMSLSDNSDIASSLVVSLSRRKAYLSIFLL